MLALPAADPMRPHERLAASRWPVAAAAGLAVSSLWLPWLVARDASGTVLGHVSLWTPSPVVDAAAARTISGLLVLALILLALRLGMASWRRTPPAWRRDVGVAAGFLLAAVLVALWLPLQGPCVPGGACHMEGVRLGFGPGWVATLFATLALAVGRWMARTPPGAREAMARLHHDREA